MTRQTLEMWHNLSFNNRTVISLLNDNDVVSCFYCCQSYPKSEIDEYTKPRGYDKGTAVCPKCSIDSVIPMPISKKDLEEMCEYWF